MKDNTSCLLDPKKHAPHWAGFSSCLAGAFAGSGGGQPGEVLTKMGQSFSQRVDRAMNAYFRIEMGRAIVMWLKYFLQTLIAQHGIEPPVGFEIWCKRLTFHFSFQVEGDYGAAKMTPVVM